VLKVHLERRARHELAEVAQAAPTRVGGTP